MEVFPEREGRRGEGRGGEARGGEGRGGERRGGRNSKLCMHKVTNNVLAFLPNFYFITHRQFPLLHTEDLYIVNRYIHVHVHVYAHVHVHAACYTCIWFTYSSMASSHSSKRSPLMCWELKSS